MYKKLLLLCIIFFAGFSHSSSSNKRKRLPIGSIDASHLIAAQSDNEQPLPKRPKIDDADKKLTMEKTNPTLSFLPRDIVKLIISYFPTKYVQINQDNIIGHKLAFVSQPFHSPLLLVGDSGNSKKASVALHRLNPNREFLPSSASCMLPNSTINALLCAQGVAGETEIIVCGENTHTLSIENLQKAGHLKRLSDHAQKASSSSAPELLATQSSPVFNGQLIVFNDNYGMQKMVRINTKKSAEITDTKTHTEKLINKRNDNLCVALVPGKTFQIALGVYKKIILYNADTQELVKTINLLKAGFHGGRIDRHPHFLVGVVIKGQPKLIVGFKNQLSYENIGLLDVATNLYDHKYQFNGMSLQSKNSSSSSQDTEMLNQAHALRAFVDSQNNPQVAVLFNNSAVGIWNPETNELKIISEGQRIRDIARGDIAVGKMSNGASLIVWTVQDAQDRDCDHAASAIEKESDKAQAFRELAGQK